MSGRRKILLVTNLFPNCREPNRGVFVAALVRELVKKFRITVVSPLPWFPRARVLSRYESWYRFTQVPAQDRIAGVDVYYPRFLAVPRAGFSHAVFLRAGLGTLLKRLAGETGYDLINAHWLYPDGVACSRIAEKLGIPLVLTAHGSDINSYMKMPLRRRQMLSSFDSARRITVVSREHRDRLIEAGIAEDKINIIHNGYSGQFRVEDKYAARSDLGLPVNDKKIVLFAGRLVRVKGLDYLLESFKKVRAAYQDRCLLAVVGSGALEDDYSRKISVDGLNGSVRFVGEKKHCEIARWIAASDLVCVPSRSEGCPTIVIEALACGRPVVASRVGDIPVLVRDNNGRLFHPGDLEALSGAIREVLEKNWDAQKIRETVSHLTWERCAEQYGNIYEQVAVSE